MIKNNIKPNGALVQINRFCNLKCSHCSIFAPRFQASDNRTELSLNEWTVIFERLKSTGITRVRFTGGEPFLRGDLEQLCHKAQEFGLEVSFVTNGLLILPNNINWLKEIDPKSIWISVYGFPTTLYESITGAKDAFSRLVRTIERLIDYKLNVGLYYPIGEINYRKIGEFIRYFHSLGICNIKIIQVLEHGRAIEPKGLRPISKNHLMEALDHILESIVDCPEMKIKISMRSNQFELFSSKGFLIPKDRSCQIGLHNLWTIDSKGVVTPCCLFLNKSKLDLFNIVYNNKFHRWQFWDHSNVLKLIGLSTGTVQHCPALSESENFEKCSYDDFICPLIYAEVSS